MLTLATIKAVLRRGRDLVRRRSQGFLRHVTGVIHVGANAGQERDLYDAFGLHVVWIEPIPEVFTALQANIAAYPRHRAIQALVTDVDGKEYAFHVASNQGQSSSILAFRYHPDIWPEIRYERSLVLKSATLPALIEAHSIDSRDYQALILDTQGSELLILQGAASLLPGFRFIKTEAADFEAYEGCCRIDELAAFLSSRGFRERVRHCFAKRPQGGHYYDVIFEKL